METLDFKVVCPKDGCVYYCEGDIHVLQSFSKIAIKPGLIRQCEGSRSGCIAGCRAIKDAFADAVKNETEYILKNH